MSYKYNISSLIKNKFLNKEDEEKDKEAEQKADDKNSEKQEDTDLNASVKTATISAPSEELKNKTAEEIFEDLNKIETTLGTNDYIDAPESLGLSKVDVPEKSDDELIETAKQSLENKYSTQKKNTNQTFEQKIQNILDSKESYKQTASNKKAQVEDIYNASRQETENQALKRGLARSSIVISQLANIENSKASELSNILNQLQADLDGAEVSIKSLEEEKQTALNDLDIAYAIELEEQIEAVKSDYAKARQEAIDFNNKVLELEAEYKLKLDEQKVDKQTSLAKLKDQYNVDYTAKQIEEQKYEYVKKYLDSLDKDYALSLLLTNKKFQVVLGNNYSKLYQYIKNK